MLEAITDLGISERRELLNRHYGLLTRVARSLPSNHRPGHVAEKSVQEVFWTTAGARIRSKRIHKALIREINRCERLATKGDS